MVTRWTHANFLRMHCNTVHCSLRMQRWCVCASAISRHRLKETNTAPNDWRGAWDQHKTCVSPCRGRGGPNVHIISSLWCGYTRALLPRYVCACNVTATFSLHFVDPRERDDSPPDPVCESCHGGQLYGRRPRQRRVTLSSSHVPPAPRPLHAFVGASEEAKGPRLRTPSP